MKIKLFIIQLLTIFGLSTFAQDQKLKLDENKKLGSATKSQVFTLSCLGSLNTPTADLKWKPILSTKYKSFEPQEPNFELIKKIKAEKFISKQGQIQNNKNNSSELSTQSTTPVVGTNFLGNVNAGYSPLDNSIAISDGGIIVSVANATLEIDDILGNNLYYNDISTFFNDASITNTCDPVVLYDKIADRFIFFFQECAGIAANSYLCICFSKTNNPATGGWWKYKLTGNPLNDNSWFDYPKMAISSNELYITGNLFFEAGGYNQSLLYQIQKAAGYAGGNLNWQYWNNIAGSPFTLLPVGSGQDLLFGPGCYLVSTSSSGASDISLYELTDDLTASNEQLNYYSVPTTAYSPAGNSYQLGTSCLLDNGDCRSLSGFYLNGIIHFVFHSDIGNGWNGINYNRLNVGSQTNQSSMFGLSGTYDYSYPSVSSFTTNIADKSVMIGFGRAGSSIYPEVRVINCDDGMNWSNSTLVKSSSFACQTSSTVERWGDYTGTARKHNSINPSIWMSGMFGNSSNSWDTWVAEIHDNSITGIKEINNKNSLKVFPNPVLESFTIDFSLSENTNLEIGIFDISGKMVKELYNGKGVQGENVFSFNKANLSPGTYFLIIKNNLNTIKNEKIIIAN